MKGYWLGKIIEVSDRIDNYSPVVTMTLEVELTEINTDRLPLPRASQRFWLVDDETFKRRVWKDAP